MATKQFQNAKLNVTHLDLKDDASRSVLQSGENISHSLGKIARWYKDIIWTDSKATTEVFGIVKLSDDYKSESTETVPTSKTLNDVVKLIKQTGGWNTTYDFNSNIEGDENLQNGQFKVTEHDLEGDIDHYVSIKGLGSAAFTDSNEYAIAGHTHLYAGSDSVGGAATSANKLNTDAGSTANPVYFKNGIPVACKHSLNSTVPSDAVFTDTTYTIESGDSNGQIKITPSVGDPYNVSVKGLGSAAYTDKSDYATAGHTHKYAGSDSVGGAATSANKLNTDAGSDVTPIYFSNGIPVACTYSLNKTVPANALFTDENVTQTVTTTDADYEILFSGTADNTTRTEGARKNSNLTFNPSTGVLTTTTFVGELSGNATSATTANKLSNTTAIGSSIKPVYFSADGIPVAINHSIETSVPSNAIFTDTTYTVSSGDNNGQIKVTPSEGDPYNVSVKGLGSAAYTDSDEYATAGHTHKYAGSSSAGGVANSAAKLSDIPAAGIGSETKPVFFSGTTGRPVACTYSLNATVPANAIFTDEKVKQSPVTTDGSFEVLFAGSTGNTEKTEGVGKTTTLTFNPSTGALSATSFSGNGSGLTSLNASNISSGTLSVNRLPGSAVTVGTYGPAAGGTLSHSGTFDVPDFTVDAKGRITGAHTRTFTLPAQYTHPTHTSKASGLYKITVDSLGHVSETTAVTKSDIPALDYISSTTTRNPNVVLAGPASGTTAAAPTFRALVVADLPSSGATAGSYGPSSNATPGYGSTFNVPYITIDAKGRVTGIENKTVKIPASDNTNTTYTFATGDNNGTFKVTPSGGTATNIAIKGLGSAAYTASSAYAAAGHTHTYIESKGTYKFDSSTLPNSFDYGISTGFVNSDSGFGSYGTVLTVRSYTGGGGTLQLYAPYSEKYGGTHMKARFGNYAVSDGNSWTALKEIAWVSDIPSSIKNPNALTVKGNGTASFTYDGSAAKTLNIKPGTGISVSSDTSGNITITNTSTNTDTKVTQTATTTSAAYEVLFSGTADNTTRTEGARKSNNLLFNPSTGVLQISGTEYGAIEIYRKGSAYGAAIEFYNDATNNTKTKLGSICMKDVDGDIIRYLADDSTTHKICDTKNTSFTRSLSSGTKIGTITIAGTSTDLYCQTNTNTTYSFATGDTNGTFKVTPSGGSATNIAIKGLGSAAYTASSAYAAAGHTHNYAGSSTAGGPATLIAMARVKQDSKVFPGQNRVKFEEYTAGDSYNLPTNAWYHIISMQGADTRYGTQIAIGMTANKRMYFRNYNESSWQDWTRVSIDGHTHNYAGSSSAGGPAYSVEGAEGTTEIFRHVWFSTDSVETKRAYSDKFMFEPSSGILKFNSWYPLDITDQTVDLNDYNDGNGKYGYRRYICKTTGGGNKKSNKPCDSPFLLEVFLIRFAAASTDYITKQVYHAFNKKTYQRFCTNGTWDSWTELKYTDTNTDTKNTAGSTNTSSKIFLIGATSQAANPQTYSHDTAYVGTDGCLYSNSTKVSVEGHTHGYLPLAGGTMTGDITFTGVYSTEYPALSNQIYFSGNTDWARILYEVTASDAGQLVFETGDDANAKIVFRNKVTSGGKYTRQVTITDGVISGNGSGLTTLNASNISSGTLSVDRLATSGATAGSYGPSANATPGYGATFNVPYITVDNKGRVTAISTKTVKIPASDNTNTTYTFATGDKNGTFKVTPSGGSATNIAIKGLGSAAYTASSAYATSGHAHGLGHSNFTVAIDSTTNTWAAIGVDGTNKYVLKSIRTNTNAPPYLLNDFSAGIVFGGEDTRGVISMKYNTPSIRFAGGNGTAANGGTAKWYITLSGTHNTTYNLDTMHQVTQTATTTSAAYEVLFSGTADNTTRTEGARKNSNLTFNPSTGVLTATKFDGQIVGKKYEDYDPFSTKHDHHPVLFYQDGFGSPSKVGYASMGFTYDSIHGELFSGGMNCGVLNTKIIDMSGTTDDPNSEINYKGTKATHTMIKFIDNAGDTYGNGIVIGGGGLVVVGAGESANNLVSAASLPGGQEKLYLTSDSEIYFYINCNTIGDRKGMTLNTSLSLYPNSNNTGSVGTSSNKWNAMYATTFYGAFSGSGASVTSLNASNISSGTLSADRLATSGVTAGSYGPSANATPGYGATFNVPYITVDAKGRVTAISTKTVKIPASNNTDTKVTQSATSTANFRGVILGTNNTVNTGDTRETTVTGQGYITNKIFAQPSTGNLYASNIYAYVNGTDEVRITLYRSGNSSWRFLNSGGTLSLQNNYYNDAVQSWYNVAQFNYGGTNAIKLMTPPQLTGTNRSTTYGYGGISMAICSKKSWAMGMSWLNNARDTIRGEFGAYGTADNLTYYYWGTAYNTTKLRLYPTDNGGLVTQQANGFRMVNNGYGVIFRTDSTDFYILLTDKKTDGSELTGNNWNSKRPLQIRLSSGVCNINGNAGSASKVYSTNTPGSSSYAGYSIPFFSGPIDSSSPEKNDTAASGNKTVLHNGEFRLGLQEGTTSADGYVQLVLGNGIASGTAGNKYGKISLYSSSAYAVQIIPANVTGTRTLTLPNASGTVALTSHTHSYIPKSSAATLFSGTAAASITMTSMSGYTRLVVFCKNTSNSSYFTVELQCVTGYHYHAMTVSPPPAAQTSNSFYGLLFNLSSETKLSVSAGKYSNLSSSASLANGPTVHITKVLGYKF